MDLRHVQLLESRPWTVERFDEWAGDLRAVCGRFQPVSVEPRMGVRGMAKRLDLPGLTFAHVVNDLERIIRTAADVRRDDEEHLFLLMQIDGNCGVEQEDEQVVLAPGDCTLVDSTRPLSFHFGGALSNHISVHMPRGALLRARPGGLRGPRRLNAADPMAVVLRALVAKLLSNPNETSALPLVGLLRDATAQAFLTTPAASDHVSLRLAKARLLIGRHLTEPELGLAWLAARLGVSVRTMQEDFRAQGQTCAELIREMRLRLVHERLCQGSGERGESISALAYAAGFNDISYFNRSFRALFGCAPGDVRSAPRGSAQLV